jgi:hypothetical protein
MTDTDRRLDDIEKRVRALEKLEEKRWRNAYDALKSDDRGVPRFSTGINGGKQWCLCGRDICRAPDCPSHRNDPLGR